MKLHHKGFVLVSLADLQVSWDDKLIVLAMNEYELEGQYWTNHFSVILDELASAGLITRLDHRLDANSQRLMFQYAMSDFGIKRMQATGLL